MANRSKADWAVLALAALGLAIMAYARLVLWAEDSAYFFVVFAAGAFVTALAVISAVQWKLIEIFLSTIRWINGRDDPRCGKRPPDGP